MANNMNLTQEKLEALRTEYKQRSNKQGKYPRQKMLPEYQSIYPWVMADEEDPYFAFCTVCECRLSAKRSDLGKHESSIKHTENSAKRQPEGGGIVLKGCHQSLNGNKVPTNIGDEIDIGSLNASSNKVFDEDAAFIKQEPPSDLVEPSGISVINLEELQSPVKIEQKSDNKSDMKTGEEQNNTDVDESDEDDDEDEEEEEDLDDEDDENSSVYEPPPSKRRVSETDSQSQHSNALEFLPVQVTITEGAPAPTPQQRYSLRKTDSAHSSAMLVPANVGTNSFVGTLPFGQLSTPPALPSGQTPCKITIQKITQPRTNNVQIAAAPTTPATALSAMPSMAISHQPNKLTSTITQQTSHPMHMPMTLQMPFNSHVGINSHPNRDAFDLFFDSICTSVKSLPPKLATEAKIGVMQLIGDLELRAIAEREQEGASDKSIIASGGSSGTSSSQQNSTVASTTK